MTKPVENSEVKYIATNHNPLVDLINTVVSHGNSAFIAEAVAVGRANASAKTAPDSWVMLQDCLLEDLQDKQDNEKSIFTLLVEQLGKKRVNDYLHLAKNAFVWVMVGKPTAKAIDATPLADMANKGLELLETRGESGGFVAGYKPRSNARRGKLASVGINPDTGLKMTDKEAKAYADKQEARRLKARADKARVTSDKAAKELESHVTPENKVAHISDPEHKLQTLRTKIEQAVNPLNAKAWTKLHLVDLLTEILDALPTPTE